MRFVFTKLFYVLAALALVPLSVSWGRPWLAWLALVYDVLLLAAAIVDSRLSGTRGPPSVAVAADAAAPAGVGVGRGPVGREG